MGGIVAAGHPVSAEAGAAVLREGGNAVDAAVAACVASWVAEPLLTGPGAGGYMMVGGVGVDEPVLLDFCVAPRRMASATSSSRSTCPSATPSRSSTSAPRRAARRA